MRRRRNKNLDIYKMSPREQYDIFQNIVRVQAPYNIISAQVASQELAVGSTVQAYSAVLDAWAEEPVTTESKASGDLLRWSGAAWINSSLADAGIQAAISQGSAISDAAGGATVDAEARAAINAVLAFLRARGLIDT